MALLFISHKVDDFDRWYHMYMEAQDMRDRHQVIDHQVLRDCNDKNMTFVLYSFASLERANDFKNDPELIERMKKGGVNGACECGNDCNCGQSNCPCESEEKVHCECNCGGGGTKLVIFNKAQASTNIMVKENASLLIFQEAGDYNQWNRMYNNSTDLFSKHGVISRTVYTLPENSNYILVVHTFNDINNCLEMATDPLLIQRLDENTEQKSTFAKKFALEHVN